MRIAEISWQREILSANKNCVTKWQRGRGQLHLCALTGSVTFSFMDWTSIVLAPHPLPTFVPPLLPPPPTPSHPIPHIALTSACSPTLYNSGAASICNNSYFLNDFERPYEIKLRLLAGIFRNKRCFLQTSFYALHLQLIYKCERSHNNR